MKRSFDKFADRLREIGFHESVCELSLSHHVTLKDLYEGPRTASIIAARVEVYDYLSKEGESINEIARLFDRAPNSVVKLVWKKNAEKAAKKAKVRSRNTSGGVRKKRPARKAAR